MFEKVKCSKNQHIKFVTLKKQVLSFSPARNFSKFCSPSDRRQELLDLPTDKMLLVLRSKLLILRDAAMFPLRAVPRESAILSFVLEYLQHREAARRPQAAALLACVRLHLLPLHAEAQGGLAFPADRWLPRSVLELGARLGQAGLAARLEQWERDVKYLHTQAEPNHLYRDTCADKGEARLQVQKSVRKMCSVLSGGSRGPGPAEPHMGGLGPEGSLRGPRVVDGTRPRQPLRAQQRRQGHEDRGSLRGVRRPEVHQEAGLLPWRGARQPRPAAGVVPLGAPVQHAEHAAGARRVHRGHAGAAP